MVNMKTQEELNAIKEEVDTLNKKLAELTEEALMKDLEKEVSLDELDLVAGGAPDIEDIEDIEDEASDFESSGSKLTPKICRKRKLPEPNTKRRRGR